MDSPPTFATPDFMQILKLRSVQTYNVSISGGLPPISTSSPEFGEIFIGHRIPDDARSVPAKFIKACWRLCFHSGIDTIISEEAIPLYFTPWENSTQFVACPVVWDMTAFGLADAIYKFYRYNNTTDTWEVSTKRPIVPEYSRLYNCQA
ncbi:uncharacterized protein KD926_005527 [Aspergillus affinis]|uniref:uncharacterized protein n=1 Tax=Aspergillus affinis TaxID=1070780 RepID=UPI0022FDFB6B|nr:uncharacterized protein KD926_005527 [Aspergillus affinis]KAI9042448.1 hypothetical protein KD926_005527 [Aspergillus affinis]